MEFLINFINYSSLQTAVLCNNIEMVKLLISNEKIDINQVDNVLTQNK